MYFLTLKILSAKVPWCSLLSNPPLSISLGIYATCSQPTEVTYVVIKNKRYSVYPSGLFLYLWGVYFCSTSGALPPLGQLNNLHSYSCMTSAKIQLISVTFYTLQSVNLICLQVSVNMNTAILFIFLVSLHDFWKRRKMIINNFHLISKVPTTHYIPKYSCRHLLSITSEAQADI